MRKLVAFLAAAVAVWAVLRSSGAPGGNATASRDPNRSAQAAAPAAIPGTRSSAPTARADIGFRSRDRLVEHFQKHGGEFGRVTMNEYLSMAQSLRDAPVGGDVLEVTRSADGVVSRFDRSTGAFLATDRDGTIRTFFKPNDGEAYFRRQAKRRPAPSSGDRE